MITSRFSGDLSVTPATRDRPRPVSREMIEVFEYHNPALRGIGKIMVDLGVWVVESDEVSTAGEKGVGAPGMRTYRGLPNVNSNVCF